MVAFGGMTVEGTRRRLADTALARDLEFGFEGLGLRTRFGLAGATGLESTLPCGSISEPSCGDMEAAAAAAAAIWLNSFNRANKLGFMIGPRLATQPDAKLALCSMFIIIIFIISIG